MTRVLGIAVNLARDDSQLGFDLGSLAKFRRRISNGASILRFVRINLQTNWCRRQVPRLHYYGTEYSDNAKALSRTHQLPAR
jgi:hypothetical protein